MDEIIENKELDKEADKYTKQAVKLRDAAMQDVIKKHKDKVSTYNETERQKNDRLGSAVIKEITTMTAFMDEPLTDKTKAFIKAEVANGNFSRSYLSDPKALLMGYLYNKFGGKVFEKMKGSIASSSSQAHKAGMESVKSALHNNVPIEEGSGSRGAGSNNNTQFGWKDNKDL
jgi:hypothetical protein